MSAEAEAPADEVAEQGDDSGRGAKVAAVVPVLEVLPSVEAEDVPAYNGPEYEGKVACVTWLTNYPCAMIGITIGISFVISFGLVMDLQFGGPEPASSSAALENLFYVAGWENITNGYDPSDIVSARADGKRKSTKDLWDHYAVGAAADPKRRRRRLLPVQGGAPFDPNVNSAFAVPDHVEMIKEVGALIARTQDWTLKPARAFIRGRQAERAATAAAQAKEDRATARRMLGGFRQTADPDEVQHMQTKRFHIMYTCYEAVEAKDGGLLSDANVVSMKALEDKMLKHPMYKDFCRFQTSYEMANGTKFYGLRAGPGNKTVRACNPTVADKTCVGTCQPGLTLTNYFYPRVKMTFSETKDGMMSFYMQLYGSMRTAFVKAQGMTSGPIFNKALRTQSTHATLMARPAVKALVAKFDAVGGAGVEPYEVHATLVCEKLASAQTCAKTAGCAWTTAAACGASSDAVFASNFVRVLTLSDGSGPKTNVAAMRTLLGQFYNYEKPAGQFPMRPYLDFLFDKDFGASVTAGNPTTIWTRSFFRFGGPLPGFTSKDDRRKQQDDLFVDWFQDNFRDEYESQVDQDTGVNMYYLNSAAMLDEIITIMTHDALMALLSVVMVMGWMYFQTGSLLIAIIGMVEICLSLPMAVFFYRAVFGFQYFDFLNMLVLYIILAIGADDVFIWVDAYKQSAYEPDIISTDLEARMSWAWKRASYAMLATSCTTCGAFLATAFSPLLELQSFGIFAALVILLDYVYVITWLPAATVIYHHAFEQEPACCCNCKMCWCPPKAKADQCKHLTQSDDMRALERFYDIKFTNLIQSKVPRLIMIGVGSVFMITALVLAPYVKPSIEQDEILPKDHPFQVVLDSSKNFPSSGNEAKVAVELMFGMHPIDRSDVGMRLRSPDNQGVAVYDATFDWNKASTQRYINSSCVAMATQPWVMKEKDKETVNCVIEHVNHWIDQSKPVGISKLPVEGPAATKALVTWALQPERPAEEMIGLSPECGTSHGVAADLSACKVKYIAISAATALGERRFYTSGEFEAVYDQTEAFAKARNTAAPAGAGPVFQTTTQRKWIQMRTQQIRVTTAIRSVMIAVGLAMCALLVFTHNFVTAGFATLTIGCVCACILAGMVTFDSNVGDTESICLIILAGFCVDYIVHLGHAYMESEHKDDREARTHDALRSMGVSVLSGALTSIGASSVLMLCHLMFFKKFGTFFFSTIALAWIWASFFFMPLLCQFGPEGNFGEIGYIFGLITGKSQAKEIDSDEEYEDACRVAEDAESAEIDNPTADYDNPMAVG